MRHFKEKYADGINTNYAAEICGNMIQNELDSRQLKTVADS